MQANEALQAIALHNSGTRITPQHVSNLLAQVRGVTFANITQVTKVALAAAHKAKVINKVTEASVQLFNNLNEFTSVYANAVKRTASKIANNDAAAVEAFEAQSNYFEHTDCYSVVKHKTQDKYYLYAIYNNAQSVYVCDGKQMTTAEVAQYMTPSGAKALLEPSATVLNVGTGVEHSVTVRTVGLENIVSIIAQKQLLIM
jgi:phenylpyruvate tautomerase PptA (4-oxalocrotonate tautomerase family)